MVKATVEHELKSLYKEWSSCRDCSFGAVRTNLCKGIGSAPADILLLQSYPSAEDDSQGSALCGEAGAIILEVLDGHDMSSMFATSALLCAPFVEVPVTQEAPAHLATVKPPAAALRACQGKLQRQIYLVDPYAIVAIGMPALDALACRTYTGLRPRKVADAFGMILYTEIEGMQSPVRYPVVALASTEVLLNNAHSSKGPLATAKQTLADLLEYIEWVKEYQ